MEKLDIFNIVYLNNTLIYIKNSDQSYIKAIYWVLDKFKKYSFFANFKKCWFYLDKIYFLKYIILLNKISIKTIKIENIKD